VFAAAHHALDRDQILSWRLRPDAGEIGSIGRLLEARIGYAGRGKGEQTKSRSSRDFSSSAPLIRSTRSRFSDCGSRRRAALPCERAPFDKSTNRSRSRRQVLSCRSDFFDKRLSCGSARRADAMLSLRQTQPFPGWQNDSNLHWGFRCPHSGAVATGSLLAFGFMVNSAINRIVLLEVRVERLEKVLGCNRFDDQ
jgi:hypothetical protein